ncbi:MAG TPA: DUF6350 family protein [Leifsonia sp.]|jgi:hypothetical protein|nr:hypothetical protein [Microbacteriaceae bacterium]HEV7813167.1 DUF6350 family protein [Leifsonia sp.]
MNRPLIALFAALEALLVVGIGIGIPLVPLTFMWAFQYGLQVDWIVFWRAAVDAWLLGHGADVTFTLDQAVAASTGLPGAGDTFVVTIAPLGFALVTLLLGVRAGRRIGETPHRGAGRLVAIGVVGLLSFGASLTALHPLASPSLLQGTILPTLVFALGVAIGSELSRRRSPAQKDAARTGSSRWRDILHRPITNDWPVDLTRVDDRWPGLRRASAIALTGGAASVALVLSVAAVTVAALVAADYGQIIGLFQAVQSGALGGAALTTAQLALVPNLVIWAASWLIGPGFALGTGSAVSPLGTTLGPMPAVPVFAALPTGDVSFGFLGLLVPLLSAFLAGVILRPVLVRAGLATRRWLVGVGVGMGIVGGSLIGVLAGLSAGSAGPGRLADVGPPWLLVGLWAALEIAVPATIALLVGGLRSPRRQRADRVDSALRSPEPSSTAE